MNNAYNYSNKMLVQDSFVCLVCDKSTSIKIQSCRAPIARFVPGMLANAIRSKIRKRLIIADDINIIFSLGNILICLKMSRIIISNNLNYLQQFSIRLF